MKKKYRPDYLNRRKVHDYRSTVAAERKRQSTHIHNAVTFAKPSTCRRLSVTTSLYTAFTVVSSAQYINSLEIKTDKARY